MKIIAIAGGSGSGKSTLSYHLLDRNPDIFEVMHLDDYQKWKTEKDLPMVEDMINFDHPGIIRWEKLMEDLEALIKGKYVETLTWGHRPDTDYSDRIKRVNRVVIPKKILIIDGYLSLWNPKLRSYYSRKYFLNLVEDIRMKRRNKFINPEYRDKVLIPMHNEFIEPSKKYSDLIFNSATFDPDQLANKVLEDLRNQDVY